MRQGAQTLILQAVEAEFAVFLDTQAYQRLEDSRKRVVRHGHLPIGKVATGIGAIPVKMPRSRDRQAHKVDNPIRFTSHPYVRRSKSFEAAIPSLYLKGISSGDFSEVMTVLLGKDAVGFSADTVLRLRQQWKEDLNHWDKRRLNSK